MSEVSFPDIVSNRSYPASITQTRIIRGVEVSLLKVRFTSEYDWFAPFYEYFLLRPYMDSDDEDWQRADWKALFEGKVYHVISGSDRYASNTQEKFAVEEMDLLEAGTYPWQVRELLGEPSVVESIPRVTYPERNDHAPVYEEA